MSSTIILLDPTLHFALLPTGTLHAYEQKGWTMCGKTIPASVAPDPRRAVQSDQPGLCRACVRNLGTYTGRWGTRQRVRFEREVGTMLAELAKEER